MTSIMNIISIMCIPINILFLVLWTNDGIAYNAILPLIGLFSGIVTIILEINQK